MSGVAALYNVRSIQPELDAWAFAHAAHHHDINRVIFQKYGVTLPEYVLDPFDITAADNWLYQHQNMHLEFDAILGIDGFDLLDVNFKDKNELAGWVYLNANEHYQAASILEID